MAGPPALLLVASPGPCCTCRPTGQFVRSMCTSGAPRIGLALGPVTDNWPNAQVAVSRMASGRMLSHFISDPRDHTCDATTVLQSVFEGKGVPRCRVLASNGTGGFAVTISRHAYGPPTSARNPHSGQEHLVSCSRRQNYLFKAYHHGFQRHDAQGAEVRGRDGMANRVRGRLLLGGFHRSLLGKYQSLIPPRNVACPRRILRLPRHP
jgi:hypothetical protein